MKSVNIKEALQASAASVQKRKRELSENDSSVNQAKTIKLSDPSADNEINCMLNNNIAVEPAILTATDCVKEPKVIVKNAEKLSSKHEPTETTSAGNTNSEETHASVQKTENCVENSSAIIEISSDNESEVNSSAVNASLDISTSSVNIDVEEASQKISSNVTVIGDISKPASQPVKKKRRMSPEEAQKKTEERAQKQREKELKHQEMLAKREEKRLLKEKKELEKKLAKEEKERQKEKEEQLRQQRKQQEEAEKQQKLQEKEAEKQQKLQEKEKQKQLAVEAKAEEKKRKELEKQQALEAKKKAEEEKLLLEQQKEKKAKEAFESFFRKSGFTIKSAQETSQSTTIQSKQEVFLAFPIKEGMTLAPVIRPEAQERFNKKELDNCLKTQDCKDLYLSALKSEHYESLTGRKTVSTKQSNTDEVIVLKEQAPLRMRAKLLQFRENVRPAYYGTWRKKCPKISGRNPFGKDDDLNYDQDSDDDWEDPPSGESLAGTDEEEKESDDDYEVDNEFFVPHGYLSAEEEGEDDMPTDPEELRQRLKMKEKEFMLARSQKTIVLQPIVLGCFFEAEDISSEALKMFSAECLTDKEILTARTVLSVQGNDCLKVNGLDISPSREGNALKQAHLRRPVPEEAMPFLIKLLHASTKGRQSVIKEFQEFWSMHCQKANNCISDAEVKGNVTPSNGTEGGTISPAPNGSASPETNGKSYRISKRQLDITITNISSWCKCPDDRLKRNCWWVKDDMRQKYGLTDAPVPNEWVYVSTKNNNNNNEDLCTPSKSTVPA